jgi:hypothetical protein
MCDSAEMLVRFLVALTLAEVHRHRIGDIHRARPVGFLKGHESQEIEVVCAQPSTFTRPPVGARIPIRDGSHWHNLLTLSNEPCREVGQSGGDIPCHKRPGGLLRYYYRNAASFTKKATSDIFAETHRAQSTEMTVYPHRLDTIFCQLIAFKLRFFEDLHCRSNLITRWHSDSDFISPVVVGSILFEIESPAARFAQVALGIRS